ncbi:stressosome-associated protein Prli42 [Neobacillus sp. LXY-4]
MRNKKARKIIVMLMLFSMIASTLLLGLSRFL